ncbi:uncharacterized protein LOC125239837 isoform X2 [Leguminivora glycinivorella]|uniref:uncharacterized protein LOC125239837 isoform X2 n=1 Tax=Leguminivora glycinivorella TaxID=1035111 RepID=UPI00200C1D49|nr:uncharacterized protein LOC125239837 isoform X2 [Leguminivora glycinivorella]
MCVPQHTRRPSRSEPYGGLVDTLRSGEIRDMMSPVITLATIKAKLKETGIFDPDNTTLTDREQKELKKLFETIEIMNTSRVRQPSNVQSVFSSLRMVERVVNKQTRDGQVSKSLADKFHWEKLPTLIRKRREQPIYRLDKGGRMRIFNLSS